MNGNNLSEQKFRALVSNLDGYLVTEFCQQTDYISAVYARTPNTIRIVTMNPNDAEPFIAKAVHRIGSQASNTVDNFSQGGLSAKINPHGTLTKAVRYQNGKVSWHDRHPDTNSQISGIDVPKWETICKTILSIAQELHMLPYIGWDLIVTDDGFKIIEANNNTDTDLLQAHRPLLVDDRVRSFYTQQDIPI